MASTTTRSAPSPASTSIRSAWARCPCRSTGVPTRSSSIRTIHAALDAGVNLIDTADAYARDDRDIGHGERLIAKALKGRRDDVIVATKGGLTRDREQRWPPDGRPEHLRAACEASLRALETDRIDLYQFHRPDPKVPYAESVGTFKELQDEGKVRWVGISNATVEQLEEALGIVDVVSVQNQLSLPTPARSPRARCRRAPTAASPSWRGRRWAASAPRSRPSGVDPVAAAAEAHGVSPQQVALAWLLSLGPRRHPDPGLEPPETITDSLRAAELELSDAELQAISAAVGVA